jgi:large subunit ribosomal protein L25
METRKLSATTRTVTGKQVGQLRRQGMLPAVMYGPGTAPQSIQFNSREASKVFRRVHGAELIDLEMDGEMRKVLVHDLQRDAIRGDFLHADLYVVDMARPIRVRLPIHLAGTSPAVVSLSGVLVRGIPELEVECLPGDLITQVVADLGELKEIGNALHVRDLSLPKTIKVLTDPDEQVVRITYQAKEEDLSTPTTATSDVEVIEKGILEEEGEEGEAPAGGKAAAKAPAAKAPAGKAPAAKAPAAKAPAAKAPAAKAPAAKAPGKK